MIAQSRRLVGEKDSITKIVLGLGITLGALIAFLIPAGSSILFLLGRIFMALAGLVRFATFM
jgi:hypothetical protein